MGELNPEGSAYKWHKKILFGNELKRNNVKIVVGDIL